MAFELSLTAPGIKELTLTATTLYLEVARLDLFLNIWDMPVGERWIGIAKHDAGKGLEVRLGPVLLSVGINQPVDYAELLAKY